VDHLRHTAASESAFIRCCLFDVPCFHLYFPDAACVARFPKPGLAIHERILCAIQGMRAFGVLFPPAAASSHYRLLVFSIEGIVTINLVFEEEFPAKLWWCRAVESVSRSE
jgi:hypothetical protein